MYYILFSYNKARKKMFRKSWENKFKGLYQKRSMYMWTCMVQTCIIQGPTVLFGNTGLGYDWRTMATY